METPVIVKTTDGVYAKRFPLRGIKYEAEICGLRRLRDTEHFPQIQHVDHRTCTVYTSDCGERLHKSNLPVDWQQQIAAMNAALVQHGVQHCDISSRNMTVKNGVMYLIDFDHSRTVDDEDASYYSELLHAVQSL